MDNELKILEHRFNMQEYQKFCMQFLNLSKDQLLLLKEQKIKYPVYRDYVYSYYRIADYIDNDGKTMMVLAIKLIDSKLAERARSMQRNLVARLLEDFSIDAALVAFYSDEDSSWRLSYVNLDYEFSADGLKKKITPATRYSYLVGVNEPNHTAREQLRCLYLDDKNNPSIKEIEEAFKIEKVTKRFFDEYRNKYLDLKTSLEMNAEFLQECDRLGFTSEEFAKKLMGQLAFLYFLQKKGWLGVKAVPHEIKYSEYVKICDKQNEVVRNVLSKVFIRNNANMKLTYSGIKNLSDIEGDYLAGVFTTYVDETESDWGEWGSGNKKFIRGLFNICIDSKKDKNFFNDYLEPLFYSALNTKRGANEYFKLFNCKIPFLNGGLFEPVYGYDWQNIHIKIPNNIFSNKSGDDDFGTGILDVFDTYNFTMNEDEPLEKEVAVDPEMLGKIFENLLDVKDRKSKGAFYTPREIVHYMCQESLINYLQNQTDINSEDIENFIKLGDFIVDEDSRLILNNAKGKTDYSIPSSIYDNLKDIDKSLKDLKVADPAVGSGAFPLGMMNEIVRIRSYLTIYMTQGLNKDDKLEVERKRSSYKLKEEVMKYVIHAVDIERSAVDITKLRLWLSLIVDADSHIVNALPNLDGNIKCGNSLIDEFEGIKLFNESLILNKENSDKVTVTQLMIHEDKEKELLDTLEILQKELFGAKEPDEKRKLKELIDKTEWQLIEYKLKKDGNEDKLEKLKFLQKENRKPYFLWKMEFSEVFRAKGGFDIVIGNPPYVGESGNKDIFRLIANTTFGKKYYVGKMDLFYFFFHKGVDIGNKDAEISLITTNYYPTAFGAKILREDFKKRTQVRKLINFNELKIFESAMGQHNMITMLTKSQRKEVIAETCMCGRIGVADANLINLIVHYKDEKSAYYKLSQASLYEGNESYIRLNGVNTGSIDSIESVLEKMVALPTRLGNITEINQGVVTGCDYVSGRNIDKLPKGTDVIKNDGIFVFDLNNSRDVEALESFKSGIELLRDFYKNSDISKYWCSIKPTKKLLFYQDKLDEKRYPDIEKHLMKFRGILETRLVTYNENYHWTAIHRAREKEIFTKPKILAPYRAKTNAFAYTEVEWFCRSDAYVITSKKPEYELKYLLALLNSKPYFIWLYFKGKRKGEVLELFQVPLSEIPIMDLSEVRKKEYASVVIEILEITQNKSYLNDENLKVDVKCLRDKIDRMVYNDLCLSEKEIQEIESNYREV